MNNKLPSREEQKMTSAISAVLRDVGKGSNPEEAIAAISKTNGFTSAQVERVCEACNKISSIKYLSTADIKMKSKPFPLADSKKVIKILRNEDKAVRNPVKLRKTASDGLYQVDPRKSTMKVLGIDALDRASIVGVKLASRGELLFNDMKYAGESYDHAVTDSKRAMAAAERAFADLLTSAERASKTANEDLASYLVNSDKYGQKLLVMLSEHLPAYKDASDIDLGHTYVPTNSLLEKKANIFLTAIKEASIADLRKEAATGVLLDMANLGLNLEQLKDKDPPKEVMAKKDIPLSASSINRMNELSLKDTFANMYLDDEFLMQYEPEVVLDAYNKVLQMMPSLHSRQNADALITAMVKKVITSGNQIDPLEIPGLSKAESDFYTSRAKGEDILV